VASCSHDSTVNIRNPNTWSSIQTYKGHASSVLVLDQIDDDTIVSGSFDHTIQIWKISTGENIGRIDVGLSVFSLKVLLNGFQIICGLEDYRENLRIYNYSSGELVKRLYGNNDLVYSIEVLNEQYLASGSRDKRVIIWDLETYSIKYNLTEHFYGVKSLKLLSSNFLASADDSGLIIIWNWLQGTLVHSIKGHGQVNSLDLYDDQTLVSGSRDKTIKFWNIFNGSLIETINTGIEINALATLYKGNLKVFDFIN
jgi:WD40 repeat protein